MSMIIPKGIKRGRRVVNISSSTKRFFRRKLKAAIRRNIEQEIKDPDGDDYRHNRECVDDWNFW